MAGTVGRIKDLVVKDGEVEGQTQADGVGRRQLGLGDIGSALRGFENSSVADRFLYVAVGDGNSYLVSLVGGSGGNLALLAGRELGEVAVVVALPT